MKHKYTLLSATLLSATLAGSAAMHLFFNNSNGISEGILNTLLKEITFTADKEEMTVAPTTGTAITYPIASMADMTFQDVEDVVTIVYSENSVKVVNPLAFEGVTVAANGAHVTVNSTSANEIEYQISGSSSNGSLKIYQKEKCTIKMKGVSLTNPTGAAINIQGKKLSLSATDGTENYLCDGSTYNTPEGEKEKGTVYSKGKVELKGKGQCTIVGKYKHAICTDGDMNVTNGTFIINEAAGDAINCEGFAMEKGTLNLAATGDCIDASTESVSITGGSITGTLATDASKGLKTDGDITITDGVFNFTLSGNAVVEDSDVSYTTAIKGHNVNINGGAFTVKHTGTAGRGISADANVSITGGAFDFNLTGAGGTYTNASNVKDSYVGKGIKSDSLLNITGGTIKIVCTGSGAKCIEAGTDMVIGTKGGTDSDLYINISSSGATITLAPALSTERYGGGGGGGGGGFGPGGGNNSGNHSVAKGLKAKNDLTINSGTIEANTPGSGAEAIESKGGLTINGGRITAIAHDDAINGGSYVKINGGYTYAYAANNDGIDSNGYFEVTGGVTIASGAATPEEGFDYDTGSFAITGGIIVAFGGNESSPTTSKCTQRSIIYSAGSITNGTAYNITSPAGDVLTFKVPRAYTSCKMLITTPAFTDATTQFTITKSGTISGGTEFNGYFEGATYTGGTTAKTFKCTSMVTTI